MTAASPVGDVFIDIGKSGIRGEIVRATGRHAFARPGISPVEPGDHGELLGVSISAGLAEAGAEAARHILIGSTSELTDAEKESLFRRLRPAAPHAVIAVTDDGTLAHARRLGAPGILLAVGTGVIAIARSNEGDLTRYDGWGPLSGDRGAAVDVGRQALRAAYAAADGGTDAALRTAVERRLGSIDLVAARRLLTDPAWPALLAQLAQDVCTLADAGDPDAARILDDAAAELAATVRMALAGSGARDLAIVGRFGTAPAMASRLERAIVAVGARPVPARGNDAVGAREILAGPYASSFTIDVPHDAGDRA